MCVVNKAFLMRERTRKKKRGRGTEDNRSVWEALGLVVWWGAHHGRRVWEEVTHLVAPKGREKKERKGGQHSPTMMRRLLIWPLF